MVFSADATVQTCTFIVDTAVHFHLDQLYFVGGVGVLLILAKEHQTRNKTIYFVKISTEQKYKLNIK